MKIYIKTYGCQANVSDSEVLAGKLKEQGNEIVNSESKADKIIVNTCSVKNKTQSKILHYIEQHNDKQIEVGGCLPKTLNFDNFENVKVIDTINVSKLNQPILRNDNNIAIIQISQGCLNFCTFCATKLARGQLKSYRIGDIKRELEKAVNENIETIYLTSQDNGCYGLDINTNLPELLKELITVEGNYKIRIGMMNPWHLRKIKVELLEIMKSDKIQKFLHIPVQAGSESVLKHMKRIHSALEFQEITEDFRKAFPRDKFSESTISTDIIVGYPTETNKDFEDTLQLITKTKPEVLNISSFSSRPKTAASKLKQLSSETIKERTKQLNNTYLSYRKTISLPVIA